MRYIPLRSSLQSRAICVLALTVMSGTMAVPAYSQSNGAVAFAKLSTDLGSSDSLWYYAADPGTLGPFQEPSGLIADNGKISAAAASPCPRDEICVVQGLVPDSNGEGWGAADLASGTLKVYASADGRTFDPNLGIYVPLVEAEAYAGFRDVITAAQDGLLQFDLHIVGSDTYDPRDGGTADYINFLINGSAAETIDGHGLASNDGVTFIGCGSESGSLTPCDVNFLVDVPVLAGDQLDLSLLLGVVATDGTADYGHTLTLSATGVPFTSASGVFLTNVARGVPEPSTWAMLLLGFTTVGAAMRRSPQANAWGPLASMKRRTAT